MLPLLLNPQLQIITANYTVIKDHWGGNRQKDGFCRLYYPVKGSGRIQLDGKDVELNSGNFYLIPSDTPFRLYPSEGMGHYWIHFLANLESGMNLFSVIGLKECRLEHISEYKRGLFSKLMKVYKQKGLDNEILLISTLMEIIYTFFRENNIIQKVETMEYLRFEKVIRFVRENYMNPISSKDLAEVVNLHPGYFSGLFTSSFGITPVKYINKVRIEQAQLLLIATELRVNKVAQKTGFSNEYYFSETFKQYTGQAPSNYRKIFNSTKYS